MADIPEHPSKRPASWTWLSLLLAFDVQLELGEIFDLDTWYTASLPFEIFLPLITAIVAHRHGVRVFGLLAILAIPGTIDLSWAAPDTLYFAFEYPQWLYLLAFASACLFCRPAPDMSLGSILNARIRWARWLMLASLCLMLTSWADVDLEIGESLAIGTNIGALLLAALILISIDWAAARAATRELLLGTDSRVINGLRLAALVAVFVAIPINVYAEIGRYVQAAYTFTDVVGILFAGVLIATATGAVDWRLAIALFAGVMLMTAGLDVLYEFAEARVSELFATVPDDIGASGSQLEDIIVDGSRTSNDGGGWAGFVTAGYLVNGAALGLLGAALWPALRDRDAGQLETRRSGWFTVAAVALLLAAIPRVSYSINSQELLVLATAAAMAGYRFRRRAIWLAPLALIFAFFTCAFLLAPDSESMPSGLYAIDIALATFPAAFFGLLANRAFRPAGTGSDRLGAGT